GGDRPAVLARPVGAAIGGAENGPTVSNGDPDVGVRERDRAKRRKRIGICSELDAPGSAAISGVENGFAFADRGAGVSIHEAESIESIGGPAILERPGGAAIVCAKNRSSVAHGDGDSRTKSRHGEQRVSLRQRVLPKPAGLRHRSARPGSGNSE